MKLHELLEQSALRHPDSAAVAEPQGRQVTYRQLDEAADEFSARLRERGVLPGDRVGLWLEKRIESVVAIFGILKTGAAYVPVDVEAPLTRCSYILRDCDVAAVIVAATDADRMQSQLETDAASGWHSGDMPAVGDGGLATAILTPETHADAGSPQADLAYILYTSGSTGQPKGVMHSHRTALSFIDWCSAEFRPGEQDCYSSHAPFHFDLSIHDIFVPLRHGARLVLLNANERKQPALMAELIEKEAITVWYSTPTALRMLLEHVRLGDFDHSALRAVLYAGEVFPVKYLQQLMRIWNQTAFYNLFGPTETNVCTAYRLPAGICEQRISSIPIGKVCSGASARVMADGDRPAKTGESGELQVSDGSVMLGYWNLPERNAAVFVEADGKRWFRTGDLVIENEDGDFLFQGRRDRMVKRRGYRVELGEIENALLHHEQISAAAAVAIHNQDGDTEIYAFFAWNGDSPASIMRVKQHCSRYLPLYMMPDRMILLDELPQTSTDKTDYQKLRNLANEL